MLVSIHIMNNQRIDMGATEKWQPCEVFVVKCAFHRNFLFWGCSILPGARLVLGTRTGGGPGKGRGCRARGSCYFTATLSGVMRESSVS